MNTWTTRLSQNAADSEQTLRQLLPLPCGDPADTLREAMCYTPLIGGKRLRAHLVLEFCALCGGAREVALPYAAGIEMMHAFSLIHDDLPAMDNDSLRRGKPTNHVLYGESTALLAGDALALYALQTLANNPHATDRQNLDAVRLLSANAGVAGMCGGQQIDLQSEGKQISREVLEILVDRKTGDLFAAACELGCIASNASGEQRSAAERFGRLTGLAFQIADDLLDLHATAETLGKTPGKDLQSGKSTFPALLGEAEAKALACDLCEQAKQVLCVFPESEARDSLCAYCDYITAREK